MKIEDLLSLTTMEFFDTIKDDEIVAPDMMRYIKFNFNNDIILLKAFRKEAQSYKEYYDHIFNEEYYEQQSDILHKQIVEGIDITIPHHYEPDTKLVMDEIRKIDNFRNLPIEEKQRINRGIRNKILEENPDGKKILLLDIKYPYNWGTHSIGELIRIISGEIENLMEKSNSKYVISEGRKTDFVKIISAMYDLRMFDTIDGFYASNKEELIKSIALFFNTEINNASRTLSDAKKTENYLNVFDDLKIRASEYYTKITKNDKIK